MKVYVLQFHDCEGSFFVSAWSTEELAKAERDRLNGRAHSDDDRCYDYEEVVVDNPLNYL